tara:strand:- start:1174 stop:2214 length:1041 start_codon:yes stop_codon:yes gene_type:complete
VNEELDLIKLSMLTGNTANSELRQQVLRINQNYKKPLSKFNPWAFWVEIVRGCNLTCWHCPTRLFPRNEYNYMTKDTWLSLASLAKELSPFNRLEFGNAGEPTLHPELLEYLSLLKEISPHTQTQLITNGTTLINKTVSYKELFDAGLNIAYVDMYAPLEKHIALAKESGYLFYEKDNDPGNMPKAWTYHNDPDLKVIILVKNPSEWAKTRINLGLLHTFLNKLDWVEASKHGMSPVETPPTRRCDIPSKFVSVYYDGSYAFCCNDFFQQIGTKLGNVSDGVDGFMRFWLGKYMQKARLQLHNKDRKGQEYCSQCRATTIRGDIDWWEPELLEQYWAGSEWRNNEP